MDSPSFRPELWKGEWKRQSSWKRQYGRYDFERFPKQPLNFASVGGKDIGKVHVDCRFLFNESKFGLLNIDGISFPAGIIRLDLSFSQVQGYKLMWATIKVTLDGEHKDLESYRDATITEPGGLVYLTHWGPDIVLGNPVSVSEKKTTTISPSITLPQGVGVSGLGRDGEKSFDHDVRWVFTGSPRNRQKKGVGSVTYDSLEWHLWENDLESQSSHGNKFQTAFAFVNNGQPFLMRVEIDGGLQKIHHRFREKIKFGSGRHGEEKISTTLVRGFNGRKLPLDELADHLNEEMRIKNGGISYTTSTASLPTAPAPPTATSIPPAAAAPVLGNQMQMVSTDQLRNMTMSLISPDVSQDQSNGRTEVNCSSCSTAMDGVESSVAVGKLQLQKRKTFLQMLIYAMQYWLQSISQFLDQD